jgi:putative nucleotidyltransferase with HDIG domain
MSNHVEVVSQMPDQDQMRDRVRELLPELREIDDQSLRDAVTEIWLKAWVESGWDDIGVVPKNPSATKAAAGVDDAWTLITHTRVVAQVAAASADIVAKLHGISYDLDTVIALALLHDVSKLLEYEGTESSVSKSRFGDLIQHGVYGAFLAWQEDLPVEIVHGIIAHTPSSRSVPRTQEALIVRYADFISTDTLLLDVGEKLFIA